MNIILFNSFKKRDPKNVIVIEKMKVGVKVKSKAHCLHPLPDNPNINPSMEFPLRPGKSITVYVDSQSGVHTHKPNANYLVDYALEWYTNPNLDIIEFTPDPDSGVSNAPKKRRTDKFKKNHARKTEWNVTIKFPTDNAEVGALILEGNHTVEVGDDDQ